MNSKQYVQKLWEAVIEGKKSKNTMRTKEEILLRDQLHKVAIILFEDLSISLSLSLSISLWTKAVIFLLDHGHFYQSSIKMFQFFRGIDD